MKQKWKLLGTCCLLFCLLLQCFVLQPVAVLAAPSASVSFSSNTVKVGDTVTVTVTFSGGGTEMGSIEAEVTYDSSVLSFESGDNANEYADGKIYMVTNSTSGVSGFTFTLKFKANKTGSASIKADTVEFVTWSGVPVENTSASKSLTVQNAATPTPTKTATPTKAPTKTPTKKPTATKTPTKEPTQKPTTTKTPTKEPTKAPTSTPTATATAEPTETTTVAPTVTPDSTTDVPTELPSETPTQEPDSSPTNVPTDTEPSVPQETATAVQTITAKPTAGNTTTPKQNHTVSGLFSVQAAFLLCAIGMFFVGGTVGFILCYVVKSKR